MYKVEKYTSSSGNCPIDDYINDLALDNKGKELSKIFLFIGQLEEYGYAINDKFKKDAMKMVDKDNKIYELRPDNTRILYFFMNSNQEYVLLHAFTKKTQKTPKEEINKAINEKKDYIRRNEIC